MAVGYGSLIVADAHGRHLEKIHRRHRARPISIWFFARDQLPAGAAGAGACAGIICMGVARARYQDVIDAALSGDPGRVAGCSANMTALARTFGPMHPGANPRQARRPICRGAAGSFAPLWTDAGANQGSVIYDRDFDLYLAVYGLGRIYLRASTDLIHWTPIIGVIPAPTTPAATYYYPTLIGDTRDSHRGRRHPRVSISPASRSMVFQTPSSLKFEYVQLTLTGSRQEGNECARDR